MSLWVWIIIGLLVVLAVVLWFFFPKKASAATGKPGVASTGGTRRKEPVEELIKINPPSQDDLDQMNYDKKRTIGSAFGDSDSDSISSNDAAYWSQKQ